MAILPDLDRLDRVTSSRWTKDLATDRDLYDLDITYDRNSNILRVEDHVQTGFDVAYTMDDLNRLTVADQGTWTGSAITSTTRTEDWTLDQVGNWDEYDLDEDGDATLELEELRGHTLANELTSRNINSTGPVEYEPEYDGAGHLVDDTEDYAYVWDAFGRLRQVKETGTGDLVAEYTYNGLGYRIGWHYDADVDGDVDGSDPWYRFVYDERWRIVATYRAGDAEPKEQFVHHAAGDSGYGTASYIDDVILRDRDDNSGWTSAADGTLEERIYHCQNWRHDVVALVDGNGDQVEMARYSPYGVPFGLPAGDLDSDGDVDAADLTVFDALIAYDVRADLDLDGDYDATDRSTINANRGTSAGLGVLSQSAVASRRGYAGYAFAPELQDARRVYHVRYRVLDADLGRWMRRDPIGVRPEGPVGLVWSDDEGMADLSYAPYSHSSNEGCLWDWDPPTPQMGRPGRARIGEYIDGPNLLQYAKSDPTTFVDPFGLACQGPQPPGGVPSPLPLGPRCRAPKACRLTTCAMGQGNGCKYNVQWSGGCLCGFPPTGTFLICLKDICNGGHGGQCDPGAGGEIFKVGCAELMLVKPTPGTGAPVCPSDSGAGPNGCCKCNDPPRALRMYCSKCQ